MIDQRQAKKSPDHRKYMAGALRHRGRDRANITKDEFRTSGGPTQRRVSAAKIAIIDRGVAS